MHSNSSLGFDFNSQKGIAILLASLRASSLGNVEKNEIRDLIFSYTNGGGDASIRIALEQKLKTYNIKPTQTTTPTEVKEPVVTKPVAPKLPFGSSRPVPVFKVVSTTPEVKPKVTQTVYKENTTVKPTEPVKPIENKKVDNVKPEPKVILDEQKNIPPEVKPEPKPAEAKVTESAPVNNAYLDRIREIKSIVNKKVGNPVNLVDIDNQVGREYMSALLEAMKKLSGGIPGQLDLAMKRLEVAFSEVEKAIETHNKAVEKKSPEPEVVKKDEVDNYPTLANNFTAKEVLPENPITTPDLNIKRQTDSTVAKVENSIPVKSDRVISDPWQVAENILASSGAKPTPVPTPDLMQPVVPSTPKPEAAFKVKSVLNEEPLAKPTDLPLTKQTEDPKIVTDPLYTNEVSAGLDQLLSEWSIFKKSGLFGTGPKGKDHPLFKKIADLQIPLLLAGRFEGSTQEIKQSITDYMNGWRYEQGIIYENGETFEKYLRRVIKQILDLQKKRIPS